MHPNPIAMSGLKFLKSFSSILALVKVTNIRTSLTWSTIQNVTTFFFFFFFYVHTRTQFLLTSHFFIFFFCVFEENIKRETIRKAINLFFTPASTIVNVGDSYVVVINMKYVLQIWFCNWKKKNLMCYINIYDPLPIP